jgi:hypothetical protein
MKGSRACIRLLRVGHTLAGKGGKFKDPQARRQQPAASYGGSTYDREKQEAHAMRTGRVEMIVRSGTSAQTG